MNSSPLHLLILVTIASSMAIVLLGVMRKPLRYAVGARVAYWLWLLVPASVLAALLPAPLQSVRPMTGSVAGPMDMVFSSAMVSFTAIGVPVNYVLATLTAWLLGAAFMFVWLVRCQRAFVRSLGEVTTDPDGICRSRSIVAPILVGAWRPRVIVPADFEVRFNAEERSLVLAHERAHLVRRDVMVNVFATGWLCLAWFNPLMYWGLGRLRFDQELACDALVLAGSKTGRRRYADALLKAQLANESAWRLPLGCHWQSTHPLKERIAMLKYCSPGLARRLSGMIFCVGLSLAGSYAVWAAQPEIPLPGASAKLISINMQWWVNGKDVLQPSGASSSDEFLVVSGKEFVRRVSFGVGHSYETRCFASLSNADKESSIWETAKASGQTAAGLILLECKLSNDDKVFSTPAILVGDSKVGTIEVANRDGSVRYKVQIDASTSPARTAAAH
jgi:bla regulator protein blaR1